MCRASYAVRRRDKVSNRDTCTRFTNVADRWPSGRCYFLRFCAPLISDFLMFVLSSRCKRKSKDYCRHTGRWHLSFRFATIKYVNLCGSAIRKVIVALWAYTTKIEYWIKVLKRPTAIAVEKVPFLFCFWLWFQRGATKCSLWGISITWGELNPRDSLYAAERQTNIALVRLTAFFYRTD